MLVRLCLLASALVSLTPTPASQCGGCCAPQATLPLAGQSPTPDDNDEFGLASASSGNWLVVGAPGYDGNKGAVFAYVRTGAGWTLDDVLLPPAVAGNGRFGFSVAIGRGFVVIGAPQADVVGMGSGIGNAYVYRRDPGGWVFEQELPPTAGVGNEHGFDVDVSGDTAIIGAKLEEAAYFYRRDPVVCAPFSWCLEGKVMPAASLGAMEFGEAVTIDGDHAFVGGSEYNVGTNVGAVFHYARIAGAWSLFEPELVNPSFSGPGEHYGETLDLQGSWLFVAEPRGGGGGDGNVHVYEQNPNGSFGPASAFTQILDDGPGSTIFGRSLAVSGRSLMVGAPSTDVNGISEAGTAYRFELSGGTWVLADTYVPCGLLSFFDRFGRSVALGNEVVVGAHQDDHSGGIDVGTVYTFQ